MTMIHSRLGATALAVALGGCLATSAPLQAGPAQQQSAAGGGQQSAASGQQSAASGQQSAAGAGQPQTAGAPQQQAAAAAQQQAAQQQAAAAAQQQAGPAGQQQPSAAGQRPGAAAGQQAPTGAGQQQPGAAAQSPAAANRARQMRAGQASGAARGGGGGAAPAGQPPAPGAVPPPPPAVGQGSDDGSSGSSPSALQHAGVSDRAVAGQAWALQQGVISFNQQAAIALSDEQVRAFAANLQAQADQFAQQLAALQGDQTSGQAAPDSDSAITRPEHRVARVQVEERSDPRGEQAYDRGRAPDPERKLDAVAPDLTDAQRALLDVPDAQDYDADPNDVADLTDPEPSAVVAGQQDGAAEAIQPIPSNTPDGAEVGTDTADAPLAEEGESAYAQSSQGIIDDPGGDRPSATTYRESQTQSNSLPVNEATDQIDSLRRADRERDAEEQAAALRRAPARVEVGRGARSRQADQGWINLKRDAVQRLTAAQLQLLQNYPAESQDQVYLGIMAANQLAIAADAAAMANAVQDSELRSLLQQISVFATQQQQQAQNLMVAVPQP